MIRALAATLYGVIACVSASFVINLLLPVAVGHWWWSLIFFTVISLVLKIIFSKRSDPESFTELMLGSIAGKLLISMLGVFIYSLVDKKGLFAFSMHFMAHYILFTIFEIRYLLRLIKGTTI